jgi:hypothetical protein
VDPEILFVFVEEFWVELEGAFERGLVLNAQR